MFNKKYLYYYAIFFIIIIFAVLYFIFSVPVKDAFLPTSSLPAASSISPSELKIYNNLEYGFAFSYPKDFTIQDLKDKETGGSTILAEGSGEKNSFQIFIAPFDEPGPASPDGGQGGPITPERIKKDLPGAVIETPQTALVSQKTIPALIFFGRGENSIRTREVWFVKNKNLYQVTAYDNMDNIIGTILESLKFDN